MIFETMYRLKGYWVRLGLEGDYRPSSLDTGYPRGTPGEVEGIDDMVVRLDDGTDITNDLSQAELDELEEEFCDYARDKFYEPCEEG